MKKSITLILVLVVSTPLALLAADEPSHHHGQPATPKAAPDADWFAKAKADYPLKTCVVSGDELGGEMGEAVDYVCKQDGQPERLVRFCCKMCIPKFQKDQAKYLKEIDEAAKAKKN